jgi:hypothetical protein
MRMRSGLLAESGWAFEMLNIYTCDEQLCGQFHLANLPAGFLDTVVDWFQVAMHRLIHSDRTSKKSTVDLKCVDLGDPYDSEPADAFAANCLENSHLRTHLDYSKWQLSEQRETTYLTTVHENDPAIKALIEDNDATKVKLAVNGNCFNQSLDA